MRLGNKGMGKFAPAVLGCLLSLSGSAALPVSAEDLPDDRIAQIVAQLASPSFEEREWATRTLTDEGEPALEVLRASYAAVDDLEVRSRLQEIARTIVFRDAMAQLGGFLGINLQLVGPETEQALPPNQQAIRVQAVVPDTAAYRADLHEGDLIIELNGESFDTRFTQKMFMDSIKQMPPGTQVDLTVLRDGEHIPKVVELGVRPLNKLANTAELDSFQIEALRDAARAFQEWCKEAEPSGSTPTAP
jgi:C-terminal processing protease CtpA/Prc